MAADDRVLESMMKRGDGKPTRFGRKRGSGPSGTSQQQTSCRDKTSIDAEEEVSDGG